MGKSKTYTQASNGSGPDARRQTARESMRGNDSRGGLLGRLAGVVKGGAVCDAGAAGGNAGSILFQEMALRVAERDYKIAQSKLGQ